MVERGGSYQSKEKQAIREKLWNSAFEDLIENEKISPSLIRYFCLPGSKCEYLRQIIDKYHVRKHNIVAVERDEYCYIPIKTFLDGNGLVLRGTLEELVKNHVLDLLFPFDIVNLDFCGQAFVFSGDEYQKRWDVVKYFINSNYSKEKMCFYLLLTFLGARSNKEGKKFLLEKIDELNKLSGLSKNPNGWQEDRLIQEALPKIVIDESLNIGYKVTKIDSYRYRQSGHSYNMVAFSFKLELLKTKLGSNIDIKQECARETIMLYYCDEPKELKSDKNE